MGGGGISEAKDPIIRQSPMEVIELCATDEYATITYQGIVCKAPTGNDWINECNTPSDCCSSGEFLKITPEGLKCTSFSNKASTYTTYCADCCGASEFGVITTLGLRCAGAGCTQDTECTTPLPYCDPTIKRCVQCSEDSHCPGDENYCLNNKCQQCTWDTEYSCNQQLTKRVKHCKLIDGTIKKTKELSCNSNQSCISGQCFDGKACPSTTPTWTQSTYTCTAPLSATASGHTRTITDTTTPHIGSATYRCNKGTWTPISYGCGTTQCPAQTLSWTHGSNTCTASIPSSSPGATPTITDTQGTTQGSATYTCNNGTWKKLGSCCSSEPGILAYGRTVKANHPYQGYTGITTYYDHDNDNDWSDDGTVTKTPRSSKSGLDAISVAISGRTLAYGRTVKANHPYQAYTGITTYYDHDNDNDWSDDGTVTKTPRSSKSGLDAVSVAINGRTLAYGRTVKANHPYQAYTGITTYYDHDNDNDWSDDGTITKTLSFPGSGLDAISVAISGRTLAYGSTYSVTTYYDHDNDNDWSDDGTVTKTVRSSNRGLDAISVSLSGRTLAYGRTVKANHPYQAYTGITTYYDHDNDNDWSDDGTVTKTPRSSKSGLEAISVALAYACPITLPSCSAQSAVTWTEDSHSCTGALTKTASGQTTTTTDTTGSEQGTATYLCNNGVWSQVSGTCGTPCGSASANGCALSATHHGGTSGTCAYTGYCSYTCDNGSWSRNSNSCSSGGGGCTCGEDGDGSRCGALKKFACSVGWDDSGTYCSGDGVYDTAHCYWGCTNPSTQSYFYCGCCIKVEGRQFCYGLPPCS